MLRQTVKRRGGVGGPAALGENDVKVMDIFFLFVNLGPDISLLNLFLKDYKFFFLSCFHSSECGNLARYRIRRDVSLLYKYISMRDTEKENLRAGRDGGRAKKFPNHQMLIYHHDALLSPPPLL